MEAGQRALLGDGAPDCQNRPMTAGDFLDTPHPLSRRSMFGRRGAVATSQPLAAQAGMSILQAGGNAVDAALATAIALTVVEPTMNGIGADAFALVWADGALHGLNASGRSAALATLDRYAGLSEVPDLGWLAVTTPGAVSAWAALHERFGRAPFESLFEPAIAYAEQGYAVSPVVAQGWKSSAASYAAGAVGPEFAGWAPTFTPSGRAPRAGDVVRLADHAVTLRSIAATRGRAFYEGELAEAIDAFSVATGGLLRGDDLAAHVPEWVDPLGTTYQGYGVWEIPPNGHGISALAALNIVEGFDLGPDSGDDPYAWHVQIEAMKLAYADAFAYVADPDHADVPIAGMVDKAYAATRRSLITDRAAVPGPGDPPRGGTVYLCAADGDGTMVSFIQSNYAGFGSGIVVPGTGIALQNRGANFTLDPNHPNVVAPRKRPYHTIIPGFLTRDGEPVGPFGVRMHVTQAAPSAGSRTWSTSVNDPPRSRTVPFPGIGKAI